MTEEMRLTIMYHFGTMGLKSPNYIHSCMEGYYIKDGGRNLPFDEMLAKAKERYWDFLQRTDESK